MTAIQKTFTYRTLEENGDSWLLMTRDRMILLDTRLSDFSLEHKTVSVIGRMGIPQGSPLTKHIVEEIAPHEAIAIRAFGIFNQPAEDPRTITGSKPNENSWAKPLLEATGSKRPGSNCSEIAEPARGFAVDRIKGARVNLFYALSVGFGLIK